MSEKKKSNRIKFDANFTVFILSIKDSEHFAQQHGYRKTNIKLIHEISTTSKDTWKDLCNNIEISVSYAEN